MVIRNGNLGWMMAKRMLNTMVLVLWKYLKYTDTYMLQHKCSDVWVYLLTYVYLYKHMHAWYVNACMFYICLCTYICGSLFMGVHAYV